MIHPVPISCSSIRKYSIRMWRMAEVNLSFYSGWFISRSPLFGVYKINTRVNLLLFIKYLLVFFINNIFWTLTLASIGNIAGIVFSQTSKSEVSRSNSGLLTEGLLEPASVFSSSVVVGFLSVVELEVRGASPNWL